MYFSFFSSIDYYTILNVVHTVGPCCLSILYIVVCICSSQTPNLSLCWLNGHELEQTAGDSGRRRPGVLQSMGSQSQTRFTSWTTFHFGHHRLVFYVSESISVFLFSATLLRAYIILVPWLGTVPGLIVLKAPSPSHWAIREAPVYFCLVSSFVSFFFFKFHL